MTDALVPLAGLAELMPRQRWLPDVVGEPRAICSGESVAAALQRVTTREFTLAIDALSDAETEIGIAAERASASLGRIGALLRLVRPSIGRDTCAGELRVLDDVNAFLEGLMAGQAELRSLDGLRRRYDIALRSDVLSDARDQLLHRHQVMRLEQLPAVQQGGSLQHWLHQLRRARARFAAWPIDEPMHGQHPVPDSFDAFAEGLERSYRKGRRQSARGEPRVEKWRRHAGDLGHQLELLSGSWPEVMAGATATTSDLAEVLDERIRTGALLATIAPEGHATGPALVIDEVTGAVVASLCEHETRELMAIASVLATRLYAEAPADFVARIKHYWATRN